MHRLAKTKLILMQRTTFPSPLAGMAAGTVISFCALSAFVPQTFSSKIKLNLTLFSLLLGGAAGLIIPAAKSRNKAMVLAAQTGWSGWRNFVVSRREKESEEITSFYLQPVDPGPLPSYCPGQFLTIELIIPGELKPVVRTYSLSDFPDPKQPIDHYRLSIKKEPAPRGKDVPAGLASNFLHDHVQVGHNLRVRVPAGNFVLDTEANTPIVLISNGVGITPMIAMAKAAGQRQVWFVHGCRNGEFHAFRSEVNLLAAQHPNINVHYAYSKSSMADQGNYHSEGRVDGALLQRLINVPADYFLCGSPPFMESLIAELKQFGINEASIHFESFNKALPTVKAVEANSDAAFPGAKVEFSDSSNSSTWSGEDPELSLLSLAEAEGLMPPCACRAGVCGTCATKLLAGNVNYINEPSAAVEPGEVLICIARPASAQVKLKL